MHHTCMRTFWLLCLCWPIAAAAVERAALQIESIEGEGWVLERLALTASLLGEGEGGAELLIGKLRLPAPVGELTAVVVHCGQLDWQPDTVICKDGSLRADTPHLQKRAAQFGFSYRTGDGQIEWALSGFPLLGGSADLTGTLTAAGWTLKGTGKLDAARVLPALAAAGAPVLEGSGTLGLKLNLRGQPLVQGRAELTSEGLTLGEASGRYATDQLQATLQLDLHSREKGWEFDATLQSGRGQLYIEPVFLDAAKAPIRLRVAGEFAEPVLALAELELEQSESLQLKGTAELEFGEAPRVRAASLDLQRIAFPRAYETWVQPFLTGTGLETLQTAGAISGTLQLHDNKPVRADLKFDAVYAHEPQEKYSLDALNGELHWAESGEVPATRLRWLAGNVHRLPLGSTELQLQLAGKDARLLAPLRLPLLDGALIVSEFAASAIGTPELKLDFDGKLEPLDLAALSSAMGWPVFTGTLAGELPRLSYKKEVLTLGGALHAEVFGGRIELEKFYLKDIFSRVPRLGADLRARNLDLEPFTQAFSFGKIEGRLNADVDKLRLQNWRPLSFKARLYTPEGDKSRHRISQRAVDHLASIGSGGATRVLSGTVLRFFEEFRYERLGLGCEMTAGICRMTGIEGNPKGGYYIVKGSGVPRIDVVGFVNEVEWETLMDQLRSVTQGGAPVIQ